MNGDLSNHIIVYNLDWLKVNAMLVTNEVIVVGPAYSLNAVHHAWQLVNGLVIVNQFNTKGELPSQTLTFLCVDAITGRQVDAFMRYAFFKIE